MNQEERDFVVEVTAEPSETKSGKKKRKKKQNGFEKGFFAGVVTMALLSVVIFGVYVACFWCFGRCKWAVRPHDLKKTSDPSSLYSDKLL